MNFWLVFFIFIKAPSCSLYLFQNKYASLLCDPFHQLIYEFIIIYWRRYFVTLRMDILYYISHV